MLRFCDSTHFPTDVSETYACVPKNFLRQNTLTFDFSFPGNFGSTLVIGNSPTLCQVQVQGILRTSSKVDLSWAMDFT